MKNIAIAGIFVFGFIACNSPKEELKNEMPEKEISAENKISNQISLKGTDDMRFDKTEFTIKSGKEVVLTFENVGILPIETMGHNVVVLDKDTDVAEFANASAKAKETNYISDLYLTDIIAQTKLLGPGESETIKFTLKEPGDYTFICTFPGHWVMMKGTITAI